MDVLITALHVLTCLALIGIVLLQHGKGADIGVQLGGGSSQTVFGARGAGNFLTKMTTGAAIVFMVTSFALSRMGGDAASSVLEAPGPEAPAGSGLPDLPPMSGPESSAEDFGEFGGFEEIEPPRAPEPGAAAPSPAEPTPAPEPPPGS